MESSAEGEGCGMTDFSSATGSGGVWVVAWWDWSWVIFGDSEMCAESDEKKGVSCLGVLEIVWCKDM